MSIFLPGKSIKTQLTGLLFGLTAVAIIVIGFLAVKGVFDSGNKASQIAADSMTDRVEQFLVQTTTATADKNSLIFKTVGQKAEIAATSTGNILEHPEKFSANGWRFDEKVTRLPTGQYTNSKDELGSLFLPTMSSVPEVIKRQFESTSYLDYILPQILSSEPNAVAIYFNDYRNTSRYYPNIGLSAITPPDFDITAQEFYFIATPKNNPKKTLQWTSVYDDPAGNGLMITAVYPIYLNNKTFTGTIGMDVLLNNIAHNIEDYSPIESSYSFLIDNKGRAIALPKQGYTDFLGRAPKKGEFGTNLKTVKGDLAKILHNMEQGKQGFTPVKVGQTDLYIAYAPVQGTNFTLGIVAKKDVMLQVVTDLQKQVVLSTLQILYSQILPIGIGLFLLVWYIGFFYISRITEPIKQLTAQTALVASGNFDIAPAKTQISNEISQLTSSFGRMVDDLRLSQKKIAEQNKELLRTEQTRLKASINSLNIGFLMTDSSNEVVLINGIAKQILTYEDSTAENSVQNQKNNPWTTADINIDFGQTIDFKKNLDNTLKTGMSFEQKAIEFRGHILRIFMAPIQEDNQPLGVVVLIEDITEVKALEHAKDEFFSIASHELRTPLTAVRGNAALLQQVYSPKINDHDFDEMVGDIHEASIRLIGIVNDFLDMSRLEQGKITFENKNFMIEETLNTVVYEMTTVAREKGNQFKLGGGIHQLPAVFADKNRVKQIVYNLVGNAMKFTQNGIITINAQVKETMLQISITDTGPGISEENQRLLFKKFQQVGDNPLTRDTSQGTGLGLYISKLLSGQMGGRIALENSEIGKGTTFSFSIPLAQKNTVAQTT